MARQLTVIVEDPRACSYLPDREASLEYRVLVDVSARELEALFARGFRRFGATYFRPACTRCCSCVPTRIAVDAFRPSKSQRRVARRCSELAIELGTPRVDRERLALYRAWHTGREAERGWEPSPMDASAYAREFAFPHAAARELTFRDPTRDGRLVGVGLCDETANAWSAVYFFHDPDYAAWSLGTANVLAQIGIAKARNITYLYLGFYIEACPSMRYKSRFGSREVLVGRPGFGDAPTWVAAEPQSPSA
jgi:arginine-tRNA-protein transferase